MRFLRGYALVFLTVMAAACSNKNNPTPPPTEKVHNPGPGVYVLNEGVYMAGNASLTFYDYATAKAAQEQFFTANDAPLGDVPTSMIVRDNKAYVTLSNSGKVYVINPVSCLYLGKISGLSSPRYIEFISNTKAYVSNLTTGVIDVVNPETFQTTSQINLGTGRCAEQMVFKNGYVYATMWSYGKQIIKIDTNTDQVVDSLEVGIQPQCLLEDSEGMFWTLADGGYEGSPVGFADPEIVRIDPTSFKVIKKFTVGRDAQGMFNIKLAINKDKIYYINKNLYSFSISAEQLPTEPIVRATDGQNFYSLGVDPTTGEVFVGDALDYTQSGKVYRFTAQGQPLGSFTSGIIPGAFCFIKGL